MASELGFAIDVTEAELEWVGFRGEAIIPFVRCARNQAVILTASDLYEKLTSLGRAKKIGQSPSSIWDPRRCLGP